MNLELEGRSAFVAAASSGIGRAVAARLAEEGANVTISSRSQDNLDEARAAILDESGREEDAVAAVPVDLADEEAIRDGVDAAVERFGGLDVLVTNHGGPANASFEATTLAEFDEGYRDITRSAVTLCKAALPALREEGGAITHLVAASAAEPTSYGTLGNVFRPGIYGLSKVLANEEGDNGVRSNCVAPRGVLSDRIEEKIAARAEREGVTEAAIREARVEELPVNDMGTPEEFAKAAAFLSSPAANYVTGAVLPVDGGWTSRIM